MSNDRQRVRHKSTEVGLFTAGSSAPRSLQNGLVPRNTVDQGIVTGVSMALGYMIGAVFQGVIDGATDAVINGKIDRGALDPKTAEKRSRKYSAIASTGVLFAGIAGQRLLKQKPNEPISRAALRTLCFWTATAGIAGVSVSAIEAIVDKPCPNKADRKKLPVWLFAIPVGAAISFGGDVYKSRKLGEKAQLTDIKPFRALGIGVGVSLLLTGLAAGEKFLARKTNQVSDKYFPYLRSLKIPTGHIVAIGCIFYGLKEAVQFAMRKAEQGGSLIEAAFTKPPLTSLVSGSKASLVSWGSLSREGRRFTGTVLSPKNIANVMGVFRAKQPIRIFVGLDSAESEEDRVNMALEELERTKAYERQLIVVASPTGTGYINYVMAESVEYCSRGNSAIVALQYSKRPSPLSLDRVNYGHIQYRMLLNGMKKYLKEHPQYTPKIVLFGESLGAWTSQDAFMHQGTDGFEVLGVSAALWIGTPTQSTWKNEVLEQTKRLDTDYSTIGLFHNEKELYSLPKSEREALRYVLLTNANDPISKFGLRLLVQAPDWLQDNNPDKFMTSFVRFRTPGTFVSTLVDMKNALKPKPGHFVSEGHDYRATLLPFVNAIYGFDLPQSQLNTITKALISNEIRRSELLAAKNPELEIAA